MNGKEKKRILALMEKMEEAMFLQDGEDYLMMKKTAEFRMRIKDICNPGWLEADVKFE